MVQFRRLLRSRHYGCGEAWPAMRVITGFLEISGEHQDFERAPMMKMHIEIAGRPPD